MNEQDLKERLQLTVDFAIEGNEDMNASSWNQQEGVLITHNEAILVIQLINSQLKTIPNENDKDYDDEIVIDTD